VVKKRYTPLPDEKKVLHIIYFKHFFDLKAEGCLFKKKVTLGIDIE
jgi:hypothetical protein